MIIAAAAIEGDYHPGNKSVYAIQSIQIGNYRPDSKENCDQ